MKLVWRAGLVAPAIAGAATLLALAVGGAAWALGVLAVGAIAIILFHLHHVQRLADWASGDLETTPPDGRGVWTHPFAAIRRRVRLGVAHQRDLRQIIERFRVAAEAMPDGIVALDGANRVKWANVHALEPLGLDLAKDRGQPLTNIVRQPEFLAYLERGDFTNPMVVRSFRDEGRVLSLQLVPFAVDEKLLVLRDVTQIEAIERMRRDFIANVSHELKTPLTVISGFVETLQELELDERQRARFLQLMREQAGSMQRLVEDLLTLSALESEHNTLPDDRFAIVLVLLAVSADAKGLSKGNHEISLDIGDAANVVGSREELASAFGNLVSNAIRYTPAGGSIKLAWRIDAEGSGVFSVTDSGIGIAAEHVPRLTQRFYRVDRSRSRATGGTGLGLAIVKHVLLRHQAELEISSEPGKGSTFAVRLPAKRVERAAVVDHELAAAVEDAALRRP